MDLSSPLRSLVPSLDSAVLEVLAGSESAFGATQVARLADRGSRQGVQLVLDRLVEHGLVLAEPMSRGFMYRLNRDHVLIPAVRSALAARLEFLARLRTAVSTLVPAPAHASVFGSFARGEGGPASDIDLFLVAGGGGRDSGGWEGQLRGMEDKVRAWSGNRLETVIFDNGALARAIENREPLLDSLTREAVTLVGVGAPTLIAMARRAVRKELSSVDERRTT